MQYKGYVGQVEFDPDAKLLHGQVMGTRDVITFEADAAADVEREFRASVDDYLAFCDGRGEIPEPPPGDPVVVRLPAELHGRLSRLADAEATSVDAIVAGVLTAEVERRAARAS